MQKYSRQRELILASLQSRCDHPTAEMLYMDLKAQMPSIGIATIYRNLVALSNSKQINRIVTKGNADRFDGNLVEHIHFVCNKCGCVQDIFLNEIEQEQIEDQMQLLSKSIGAQKEHTQIMLTGLCRDCKRINIV